MFEDVIVLIICRMFDNVLLYWFFVICLKINCILYKKWIDEIVMKYIILNYFLVFDYDLKSIEWLCLRS